MCLLRLLLLYFNCLTINACPIDTRIPPPKWVKWDNEKYFDQKVFDQVKRRRTMWDKILLLGSVGLVQVGIEGNDQNSRRVPVTCPFMGNDNGIKEFLGSVIGGARVTRNSFVICGGQDKSCYLWEEEQGFQLMSDSTIPMAQSYSDEATGQLLMSNGYFTSKLKYLKVFEAGTGAVFAGEYLKDKKIVWSEVVPQPEEEAIVSDTCLLGFKESNVLLLGGRNRQGMEVDYGMMLKEEEGELRWFKFYLHNKRKLVNGACALVVYYWSQYPREPEEGSEGEEGNGTTRHKRSLRQEEDFNENLDEKAAFLKYLDPRPPVGEENLDMPWMLQMGSPVDDDEIMVEPLISSLEMLPKGKGRRSKRQIETDDNKKPKPIIRIWLFIAGGEGNQRKKRFDLADLASGRWAGDAAIELPLEVQRGIVGVFHGQGKGKRWTEILSIGCSDYLCGGINIQALRWGREGLLYFVERNFSDISAADLNQYFSGVMLGDMVDSCPKL